MIYLDIKRLLKERGKSKYWLVKEMGSGYQSISAIMDNETTGIKFETIDKLCKILDCEPGDIIKRK